MTTDIKNNVKEFENIVKAMNSGIEFYDKAKSKVDDKRISQIFEATSQSHKASAARLQPHILAVEEGVETGSSFAVEVRKLYTATLAAVSNTELTYVKQLEEIEDKLLEEIDEVMNLKLPPEAHKALMQVRIDTQRTHDRLKALQNEQEAEHS